MCERGNVGCLTESWTDLSRLNFLVCHARVICDICWILLDKELEKATLDLDLLTVDIQHAHTPATHTHCQWGG